MVPFLDMLDALNTNKEHVPSAQALEESGVDLDDVMAFHDADIADALEPGALLSFPRAHVPPPMEPPAIQALRPAYERDGLFVGFDRIGQHVIPEELPPFLRFQGTRGPDVNKRQIRRCKLCLHNGRCNTSEECQGRNKRKHCPHFNEDGSSKNQLAN
jgi:hypothetical protein